MQIESTKVINNIEIQKSVKLTRYKNNNVVFTYQIQKNCIPSLFFRTFSLILHPHFKFCIKQFY